MHYGENEGTFVLCCLELEFMFVQSLYVILTVMFLSKNGVPSTLFPHSSVYSQLKSIHSYENLLYLRFFAIQNLTLV